MEDWSGGFRVAAWKSTDIALVAKLEEKYFSRPWSEKSLTDAFSDPKYRLYAAFFEDVLAGYCGLLMTAPEAEIVFICTGEAFRRKGVARLLLETALGRAKEEGITDVFLEVREGNVPARALYRGLGFTETGLRKNYYDEPKENAVLMQWTDREKTI